MTGTSQVLRTLRAGAVLFVGLAGASAGAAGLVLEGLSFEDCVRSVRTVISEAAERSKAAD